MPRKKKNSRKGRAWLNADKSTHAHVTWHIDTWGAEFSIMDCNRVATLDFGAIVGFDLDRDRAAVREGWKKLERLEHELAKFRAALEEAAGKEK